jgi:hypothetical protein
MGVSCGSKMSGMEPPKLLTTDAMRAWYDALLIKHGLPPIYNVPKPGRARQASA